MTYLLAYVYEKVIYITFSVGNSFAGGLWAAHGAADLPVTKKELYFCFSVLLNHFMNNFLIEIVTIAYSLLE